MTLLIVMLKKGITMKINITDEQRQRAGRFLELTGDKFIDDALILNLELTRQAIKTGKKNDVVSLMLPQAYQYRWIVKFNARSLQNFFGLRLDKHAHFQIKEVAEEMLEALPPEHRYLFQDYIKNTEGK